MAKDDRNLGLIAKELADAANALVKATESYEEAHRAYRLASERKTVENNNLNKAQKLVDRLREELVRLSPYDSDWKSNERSLKSFPIKDQ